LKTTSDTCLTKVRIFSIQIGIENNSQIVYTLRDGLFKEIRSDQVVVGDLVVIREGDMFPADLIVLATSNEGVCFI
jgi:P-type E1-E2 ATPase